jgi:uncharacterized protein (TIGR02569 family)
MSAQRPLVPPSATVIASFGVTGEPVPLAGGRGRAWRVGNMILKPNDLSPPEHEWQADVLARIRPDGFRLARPRRADDGRLTVDGWAAWQHVDGEHQPGRWSDIIAVGERFHRAIADLPRPDFMVDRTDPWSTGDRIAWGDLDIEPYRTVPWIEALASARRPISARSQVIHGDLTGNILFADGLAPAIIDLSPYWRPPTFATAIVVADAVVWEGADATLLRAVDHIAALPQYLTRALIFRISSAAIGGFEGGPDVLDGIYRSAVELAIGLTADP